MRPKQIELLPPGVQRGVALHRRIDGATDSHPAVLRAVRRISPEWHLFSGIILDVYFDHILARNWRHFEPVEPLDSFAGRMNGVLAAGLPLLPEWPREWLAGFVANDRLRGYATLPGITGALGRVWRTVEARMPGKARPFETAVPLLTALDAELAQDLTELYPDLVKLARGYDAT